MVLSMDGNAGAGLAAAAAALAVVAATWLWSKLKCLVWTPYTVTRAFARQGICGPPYRPFIGNAKDVEAIRAAAGNETMDRSDHDFIPRVMPQYRAWMSLYGKVFLLWSGFTPTLFVGKFDMVKRILSDRTGLYAKVDPGPVVLALFGIGLVFSNGEYWARHRRVVHPAFTMDKIKMMTGAMAACAREVVREWEARARAAAGGGEVTVDVTEQFTELTANVISHTAFGSSYLEGKEVFLAQRELQFMAFTSLNSGTFPLPGKKYLPTKINRRRWQLERKVRGTLMAIIDERLAAGKEASGYGNDLLGLMLEANADDDGKRLMTMDEIIDECKTFFFAGQDTTSHLLTWAMFLLGTHPEWQQRLREEVLQECGGGETPITADALIKLKQVAMVLYETLRLYGPVTLLARQATAETDLCGVKVPKGTAVFMPVAILHRDEEIWGADAGKFNPLRFRDGVGKATARPNAVLTFSMGPRSCIGQDFTILEAKATLALILRRFAFEVAPEYVHAPSDFLTLQPLNGLPIVLKLLDP